MQDPLTFSEFWPSYVLSHRQPLTRIFHSVGTLVGWALLLAAAVFRQPWLILAALLVPYGFAWVSHFFVEHNRPASFDYPLWSWLADQKTVALDITGRVNREVRRFEVSEAGATLRQAYSRAEDAATNYSIRPAITWLPLV